MVFRSRFVWSLFGASEATLDRMREYGIRGSAVTYGTIVKVRMDGLQCFFHVLRHLSMAMLPGVTHFGNIFCIFFNCMFRICWLFDIFIGPYFKDGNKSWLIFRLHGCIDLSLLSEDYFWSQLCMRLGYSQHNTHANLRKPMKLRTPPCLGLLGGLPQGNIPTDSTVFSASHAEHPEWCDVSRHMGVLATSTESCRLSFVGYSNTSYLEKGHFCFLDLRVL